jgi:hypothetical protein
MFTEHTALAVTPWKGTRALQLLDVLVKQGHSFHFPGSAPVITKIGTFFSLHKRSENADADAVVDKLKDAVHTLTTRNPADAKLPGEYSSCAALANQLPSSSFILL